MGHVRMLEVLSSVLAEAARVAVVLVVALLIPRAPDARATITPIFTHPPADIANVEGIIPLGNISPDGGQHVLPSDHMYLQYPSGYAPGALAFPVYAMAKGRIVAVTRTHNSDSPDSYQVYVRHNRYVTSYVIYLYELSERISAHLGSSGAGWIPAGDTFELLLLGQQGAPAPLAVQAGEQLGVTRNFKSMWDVGVVDSRVDRGFQGRGNRRYPTFRAYLKLLGHDLPNPFPGQQTRNAVSFIRYMTRELRSDWFAQLLSRPRSHGRCGWDVADRLRGAWFNPAVDTTEPPPLFDLQYAVVSITPYNLAPTTKIQIGIGQGHALAALDPTGAYPQLFNRIVVDMDPTPGARVNANPARVGVATGTVCYDLPYADGGSPRYNTLLFRMVTGRQVAIKFNPTPLVTPGCRALLRKKPDASWKVYRR